MSTRASLGAVAELVAAGVTADGAAARLGLAPDLVAAMVDELARLGLVEVTATGVPRTGCATCAPSALSPTCRACPLAHPGDGTSHM